MSKPAKQCKKGHGHWANGTSWTGPSAKNIHPFPAAPPRQGRIHLCLLTAVQENTLKLKQNQTTHQTLKILQHRAFPGVPLISEAALSPVFHSSTTRRRLRSLSLKRNRSPHESKPKETVVCSKQLCWHQGRNQPVPRCRGKDVSGATSRMPSALFRKMRAQKHPRWGWTCPRETLTTRPAVVST